MGRLVDSLVRLIEAAIERISDPSSMKTLREALENSSRLIHQLQGQVDDLQWEMGSFQRDIRRDHQR